jgi:branched-chain amino acid transport system permease protein
MDAGLILLGLVQGSLAALDAMGIVLLYRTTRVVNLAQPALGLVPGVLVGMLVVSGGWSFWWALPIGIALGAVLGMLADRAILVRLQDVPRVVLLVATVGLAQIFGAVQTMLPFIFGGRLPTYTVDLGFSLYVKPQLLLGSHILALVAMPLVLGGLYYFLHRSRIGLAACALGQDAERARALGVPANVVRTVVWAVAGAVAAVSGTLAIPILGFNLEGGGGALLLLFALTPAVLAGLRSLWGAALASLAIGVAYQFVQTTVNRAGYGTLLLAALILFAVAVQRRRLGRAASASRASSWEAATTPRPLPWAVARSFPVRTAAGLFGALAVAAVALAPVWLSPGNDVRYATAAALALGALAVAAAWMFAGEIPLGHWGLAGIGAVVAVLTPGPWLIKFVVAVAVLGASGAVLALASRRQSNLSFAVLGLAAAAAAPVAVLALGARSIDTDPGLVGGVCGVVCVVAAFGLSRLRASTLGAKMVAARDDPQRAPWLGADPLRARVLALALSASLAGLAGTFYLAAIPAESIAPGIFEPERSLELLSMAVVGGLGSPAGALLGAGTLEAARIMLPGPWAMLASGAGVLIVVMFMPAGLGRLVETVRLTAVRLIVGPHVLLAPARERAAQLSRRGGRALAAAGIVDGSGPRIAGSDTREAAATPTVRAAALAAALAAGPGWAAAFGMPKAWDTYLSMPSGAGAWFAVGSVALGVGCAVIGWRLGRVLLERRHDLPPRLPPALAAAAGLAVLGGLVAVTGDFEIGALGLVPTVVLSGWMVGQAARLAGAACVPGVRAAAQGIVATGALLGSLVGGHIGLVAAGSGFRRAVVWGIAYIALSGVWFVRARRALPADRRRVRARMGAADRGDEAKPSGPLPALVLDGVGATFGTTPVLRSATLTASAGELVALVGGNGAGKSTLLRIAAGLIVPDGGRVLVGGEDVTTLRPEERAAAGLAFVSGARPVFPDLTVYENLRVAAYRTHASHADFQAATEAVLDLVPVLAHRRGAKVGLLSGGEQRLLAVAQTLYRRPVALLADELTLGLDVEARHAVLDVLRMLADDGVAVVCVDHDLPALLPRADRAALVARGIVRDFGDPDELLRKRADLLPATFLAGVAG